MRRTSRIGLIACLVLSACSSMCVAICCEVLPVKRVPSPSGAYMLVVERRNCGATTGDKWLVRIDDTSAFGGSEQVLNFDLDHQIDVNPDVDVEWTGPDHVRLGVDPRLRINGPVAESALDRVRCSLTKRARDLVPVQPPSTPAPSGDSGPTP